MKGSGTHSQPIADLITALGSPNGLARRRARENLVGMGKPAVPALVEALSDPMASRHIRWESAKALSEMRAPESAPALVHALEDRNFGVRWLAAEGLMRLGRAGLRPLLEALIQHSGSFWLREGAHHVLRMLGIEDLEPELSAVLAAMEDIEPDVEVPPAAYAALRALAERRGA